MLKHYPWTEVEAGQGFFVPALNLEEERRNGLLAAVNQHVTDARATFVVKGGLLGVWFYRGWIAQRLRIGS